VDSFLCAPDGSELTLGDVGAQAGRTGKGVQDSPDALQILLGGHYEDDEVVRIQR
jgi:hypothetical protein